MLPGSFSFINYFPSTRRDVEYYDLKGVQRNASYLSAQEAPAQERARLPQENGDRQRPQGPRPQKSEGQSKAQLLIPLEQQV